MMKRASIEKYTDKKSILFDQAKNFEVTLPHKTPPYSSRNWGSNLHSLCSYQGKLKPAIAHFLISSFTSPGDVVLDPMAGAGTIPLEAFLQNRVSIANDIQELAFILSSAKVQKPDLGKLRAELDSFLGFIDENSAKQDPTSYSEFGYNGKVPEYFHTKTFQEILAARTYIKSNTVQSPERAMIYSSMLHILHGNRPYALSRCSHPVTPFMPTGEFEYRDIKTRLLNKIDRAIPELSLLETTNGESYFGSFEDLQLKNKVDAVITSPPFSDSTRFYSANWMRLWMSGWEPEDFKSNKEGFLEHRQKISFDVYTRFFEKCSEWLKNEGILIMHTGRTAKSNMAKEIIARTTNDFEVVYSFDEDVEGREKFGIRDQGATKSHQYVFFIKKP